MGKGNDGNGRYRRGDRTLKAIRSGTAKLVIGTEGEYLFDVGRDPGEAENVISVAASHADRLRKLLVEWEQEVAAPRLKGFQAEAKPSTP